MYKYWILYKIIEMEEMKEQQQQTRQLLEFDEQIIQYGQDI